MVNQKNDHQQHDHGCAAGTDDGQPGDRFLHRPDQAEALIAVLYGKDQIAAVLGVGNLPPASVRTLYLDSDIFLFSFRQVAQRIGCTGGEGKGVALQELVV